MLFPMTPSLRMALTTPVLLGLILADASCGNRGGSAATNDASMGGDGGANEASGFDGTSTDAPPAACALGGQSCTSQACCSGTCHSGTCVCTEATGNCQSGNECCSGVCASGVCASCNGLNEACEQSANCCGGSCKDNVCACVPPGNPCATFMQSGPTDCCSGGCYLGDAGTPVCSGAPAGGACSSSQGCRDGLACLQTPGGPDTGDGGVSQCYASVGTACESYDSCSSNNCVDNVCACNDSTDGVLGSCLQDSDCCVGTSGGNVATGKCVRGLCVTDPDAGACLASQDFCEYDEQCCSGVCEADLQSTCQ
jgi:hypothetical protein